MTIVFVSSSMPKKVRHVAGPSRLSTASGSPRMLHISIKMVAFIITRSPKSDEII